MANMVAFGAPVMSTLSSTDGPPTTSPASAVHGRPPPRSSVTVRPAKPGSTSRRPRGFWDDSRAVDRELLLFLPHGADQVPSRKDLLDAGRQDLLAAINRHGGLAAAAQRNGLKVRRNRYIGPQITAQVLREELIRFQSGSNLMPPASRLIADGRWDLLRSIRSRGGFGAVARELGWTCERERRNWHILNVVLEELATVIDTLPGKYRTNPSLKALREAGRWDLVNAIRLHGGFYAVMSRLESQNYDKPAITDGLKPSKHLPHLQEQLCHFIAAELQPPHFPTQSELRKAGRGDLLYAIRLHGGSSRLESILSGTDVLAHRKKPRGYWTDFNCLSAELFTHIHHYGLLGVMPRLEELKSQGRSDLVYAIGRHGGFAEVARRTNLVWSGPASYWRHFPNLKSRLLSYVKKRWMRLCKAYEEREKHSTGSMIDRSSASSPDPRLSKAMPTLVELYQAGRMDLIHGIGIHGGVPRVAEKIGTLKLLESNTDPAYWTSPRNLGDELKRFLLLRPSSQRNHMPTTTALFQAGLHELADAIRDNGGWLYYAQHFGLQISRVRRSAGYWSDFACVKRELLSYLRNRGLDERVLPSQLELRQDGRSDLAFAIERHHGGTEKFARRVGLSVDPERFNSESRPILGSWGEFVRSFQEWMQKHGVPGQMPLPNQLIRSNRHDLRFSLYAHGGPGIVAARLNLVVPERRPWIGRWLACVAAMSFGGKQRSYDSVDLLGVDSETGIALLCSDVVLGGEFVHFLSRASP